MTVDRGDNATHLIEFTSDLANTLKAGRQTDMLVMDFCKYFDKVSPLQCRRTHAWIGAFLSSRTQEVVVEGQHSDWVPVTSGVPQGSVLGPCLFLHYINDLPEGIRSSVRLFADHDTVMYLTITNLTHSHQLQADLNHLAKWQTTWQMKFHPDKCHVLRITNKRTPIAHNYTLHNRILEIVTQTKYLGIAIKKD